MTDSLLYPRPAGDHIEIVSHLLDSDEPPRVHSLTVEQAMDHLVAVAKCIGEVR